MDQLIQQLIELVPAWRGGEVVVSLLSGGLTNRNYRIDSAGESFVLRLCGENSGLLGIDRECEHASSIAAAALARRARCVACGPRVASVLMASRVPVGSAKLWPSGSSPANRALIFPPLRWTASGHKPRTRTSSTRVRAESTTPTMTCGEQKRFAKNEID